LAATFASLEMEAVMYITEQQRRDALAILDQMAITIKRIQEDLAETARVMKDVLETWEAADVCK
jgi:hypothetical protein